VSDTDIQFESESESDLLYDWRFTANQFFLATTPWDSRHSNFIFQLNTCGYSTYVTSSLTRGWVCRLQLLLVLASAVILGYDYRGTHNHIWLSQIRDSPNLEGQIPVFISPRSSVAQLYPQALGSLFVASYDSKEYGGGVRPHLHTDTYGLRHTVWGRYIERDTPKINLGQLFTVWNIFFLYSRTLPL
jgi:hypothetical protein